MLKVVFVGHRDSYYGAESVMFRVMTLLKNQCYADPRVVLPVSADHDFSKQCTAANISFNRFRYKLIGGSLIRCVVCLVYNSAALIRLFFYYRKHQIDKVYTNTIVNVIGPLLALLLKKPHIWHLHEQPTAGAFKWIPSGIYPLYRLLIRQKDCQIIFISKTQKQLWEKEFGFEINNSIIIYTPAQKASPAVPTKSSFSERKILELEVQLKDNQGGTANTMVAFGFLGSFTASKNVLSLIDAFALLQSEHPDSNTRLLLMGGGELERDIIAQIDALRLQNKVTLLPHSTDLHSFFSQIDVFVLPSWFESWGLAALEAVAHRKALVLTRNSALTEILKPSVDCLYTDPHQQATLYQAMEYLLLHPEDRLKLARQAYHTLQNLNLDSQFEESIVSLLKSHEVP